MSEKRSRNLKPYVDPSWVFQRRNLW